MCRSCVWVFVSLLACLFVCNFVCVCLCFCVFLFVSICVLFRSGTAHCARFRCPASCGHPRHSLLALSLCTEPLVFMGVHTMQTRIVLAFGRQFFIWTAFGDNTCDDTCGRTRHRHGIGRRSGAGTPAMLTGALAGFGESWREMLRKIQSFESWMKRPNHRLARPATGSINSAVARPRREPSQNKDEELLHFSCSAWRNKRESLVRIFRFKRGARYIHTCCRVLGSPQMLRCRGFGTWYPQQPHVPP